MVQGSASSSSRPISSVAGGVVGYAGKSKAGTDGYAEAEVAASGQWCTGTVGPAMGHVVLAGSGSGAALLGVFGGPPGTPPF